MIPKLRKMNYEERLGEQNPFSSSKRRQLGDLIVVSKIFRGFGIISINAYVTINLTSATRNKGFKIIGKRFRSNEAKHFFFYRIVYIWNFLPIQMKLFKNCLRIVLKLFKKKLEKHLAFIHSPN